MDHASNPMGAAEHLEILRNRDRPTINDYIPLLFDDFTELHGDRVYGDDPALKGGIALFRGKPVTLLAQVRGRSTEESIACNFAMSHPEGYRKALRLAKQAEKFRRPVFCFIDTPGAYCGIEAERRGIGGAIAANLMEFMTLGTPVISVVLGEGGSGGALALGVCDELAMLEHAVYSVISPRGFASILWKDRRREMEAAELMKITAQDLFEFGICETIIPEAPGGAHHDPAAVAERIGDYLNDAVERLAPVEIDILLEDRYNKFRRIGNFFR